MTRPDPFLLPFTEHLRTYETMNSLYLVECLFEASLLDLRQSLCYFSCDIFFFFFLETRRISQGQRLWSVSSFVVAQTTTSQSDICVVSKTNIKTRH